MKKLIWVCVLVAIILGGGCIKKPKGDYSSWIKENSKFDDKLISTNDSIEINSGLISINGIYRSMQGPFTIKKFNFSSVPFSGLFPTLFPEEVIWLTGYKVKIQDRINGKEISTEFMCHNNLSIEDTTSIPWKVHTQGTDIRLFTLTEGLTAINFPEGFGIPVTKFPEFTVTSQVLNHNHINLKKDVNQQVVINYASSNSFQPLYQQAVFVTKQVYGPGGNFGNPPLDSGGLGCNSGLPEMDPRHDCTVKIQDTTKYNPYRDEFGRKCTGHWKINPGIEILTTNVTGMLNLKFNTSIHYIAVHVHPFATYLELWDKTANKLLFHSEIENYPDKIGLKKIGFYSDKKGIPIFRDHQYELVSKYNNTTSQVHTAMATMFLYLAEK